MRNLMIVLILLAASQGCAHKTLWTGGKPMVVFPSGLDSGTFGGLDNYELGLRDDGVMVWRLADSEERERRSRGANEPGKR